MTGFSKESTLKAIKEGLVYRKLFERVRLPWELVSAVTSQLYKKLLRPEELKLDSHSVLTDKEITLDQGEN